MDETLLQLGELLLQSIPTVFLLLVVFSGYTLIVHRPLVRTLEQRKALTLGAMEKARADAAVAESRAAEYETRLRDAKIGIFKAQEARRAAAAQARASAVQEARDRTRARIEQARNQIQGEVEAAKAGLRDEADRIANEILQVVVKSVAMAGSPVGGAK